MSLFFLSKMFNTSTASWTLRKFQPTRPSPRDAIARRLVDKTRLSICEIGVEREPGKGLVVVPQLDPDPPAGCARFRVAGIAGKDEFGANGEIIERNRADEIRLAFWFTT